MADTEARDALVVIRRHGITFTPESPWRTAEAVVQLARFLESILQEGGQLELPVREPGATLAQQAVQRRTESPVKIDIYAHRAF